MFFKSQLICQESESSKGSNFQMSFINSFQYAAGQWMYINHKATLGQDTPHQQSM